MVRVSYGLGAILAIAVVGLLLYDAHSHREPSANGLVAPADGDEILPPPESAQTGIEGSEKRAPSESRPFRRADTTQAAESSAVEANAKRNRATTESNIAEVMLRRNRESAVRELHEAYTLLFADLDLSKLEQDELLALLVEVRMGNTWVRRFDEPGPVRLGTPISEAQRSERIATIIGQVGLQQFLALESDVESYRQTYRIGELFEMRGAPLTESQREALLDILIATDEQAIVTLPPSGAELGSRESIEQTLARMNERERQVIALVPTVLSPKQLIYLDEVYRNCSFQRSADLQRQLARKATEPGANSKFSYRPCGP